jgi:hypothetical protein
MYEYAAKAIGAKRCEANFDVKKIAVGPSAPPIIAIEAASFASNPRRIAIRNAA